MVAQAYNPKAWKKCHCPHSFRIDLAEETGAEEMADTIAEKLG